MKQIEADNQALMQVLDDAGQMIMVTDVEHLTVIYANAVTRRFREWPDDHSYVGTKCYKFLRGLDSQCKFCPLCHLGGKVETSSRVETGKCVYDLKMKLINWQGRKAVVSYIQDISAISHSDNIYSSEVDAILKSMPRSQGIAHLDLDDRKVLRIIRPFDRESTSTTMTISQMIMMLATYMADEKEKLRFLCNVSIDNLYSLYHRGKRSFTTEVRVIKRDGTPGISQVNAMLLKNPRNNHLECILSGSDVTEKKNMEKRMQEMNLLNEALAKEYGTIFVLNLRDGTMSIKKMNSDQNASKLNLPDKLPFDDFLRLYAEKFIVQEDRDRMLNNFNVESLCMMVEQGTCYRFERYRAIPNLAGQRHFEAVVLPVNQDDKYKLVVGTKCIDKEVKREKEDKVVLEMARQAAEAANKAKTAFLFNMSHDIRTPMNAIVGYTDLMSQHISEPKRLQDYLTKLTASSNFLLELINNVLEVARIDSGRMEVEEQPCLLLDFVNEVKSVYLDQIRAKGLKATLNYDVKVKGVYCDTLKVKEVLLNLISNAIKYTPSGGSITIDITQLPAEREGFVILKAVVADTGIGMSKKFLPTLFDEFARERTQTESKIEGTGLGMHIVKQLVDLMGGQIEVESELGKGSKFTLLFTHRIADDALFQKKPDVQKSDFHFEGKRILLAEDNQLNAEIAIEILTSAGIEVDHAEDGIQCVDMYAKAPAGYYDLILMDIQMPNMNGYRAARAIRSLSDKEKTAVPILAVTANAFDEDKREAIEAGMNGHLSKPLNTQDILSAIATFVGQQSL